MRSQTQGNSFYYKARRERRDEGAPAKNRADQAVPDFPDFRPGFPVPDFRPGFPRISGIGVLVGQAGIAAYGLGEVATVPAGGIGGTALGTAGGMIACSAASGSGGGAGGGGRGEKVRFGNNANQEYHTFRHVEEEGISRAAAEEAIRGDLAAKEATLPEGLTKGEVNISGRILDYNAFKLPDGTINVGRITVR
ncbi:MAG: hypothetical protein ACRD40_11340 [Candidatus Acidiferrales bacterium]